MKKRYETVFILTPVLSEAQAKEAVGKFKKVLTGAGAKVHHEENWGMKKLAYPIQKKSTGFYNLLEFEGEGEAVQKLDVAFRRDEKVMRFLTVALDKHAVFADQEKFYFLARTALVKDEKHFDKFDRAMQAFWSGMDSIDGMIEAMIPEDWLRKEFIKQLSEEEKAAIESLGGLDELIEKFKERLEEQKKRHAGGNKWIGTGGTSPFGHGVFGFISYIILFT